MMQEKSCLQNQRLHIYRYDKRTMKKPTLRALFDNQHVFHDSLLTELSFNQDLTVLDVILECNFYQHKHWRLTFTGVLKFEFETTGAAFPHYLPVDIYDVHVQKSSKELQRWKYRLEQLGIETEVFDVILCSSTLRGLFHDRKDLEGIQIICREIELNEA